MKSIFFLILIFSCQVSFAGLPLVPTREFVIEGKVKAKKVVGIDDLKSMKSVELENINTSCSPKAEETSKHVKAVRLLSILDSIVFDAPKGALNAFYFKFVASDGYTLVYSYNEIFNTETGRNMYLVTEREGIDISAMENRILLLTTSDIRTGRRNMKCLARIVVCQAE
jgi:hypothetical protein